MSWRLQDAKARFSEVVEASLRDGPQVITRRGKETAVLVSAEEWQRVQQERRAGLKELLLDDKGRFEMELPARRVSSRARDRGGEFWLEERKGLRRPSI